MEIISFKKRIFFYYEVGLLQIGIRAWLQHLTYLGSQTSHLKTLFGLLLKEQHSTLPLS
jgi:hypothetical protein